MSKEHKLQKYPCNTPHRFYSKSAGLRPFHTSTLQKCFMDLTNIPSIFCTLSENFHSLFKICTNLRKSFSVLALKNLTLGYWRSISGAERYASGVLLELYLGGEGTRKSCSEAPDPSLDGLKLLLFDFVLCQPHFDDVMLP